MQYPPYPDWRLLRHKLTKKNTNTSINRPNFIEVATLDPLYLIHESFDTNKMPASKKYVGKYKAWTSEKTRIFHLFPAHCSAGPISKYTTLCARGTAKQSWRPGVNLKLECGCLDAIWIQDGVHLMTLDWNNW